MLDGNQIHKIWLDDFWSYFGGKKNLGRGYKQSLKLKHVKRLAQVEVEFKNQRQRVERRKEFDKVKKYRHSLKTHEPCFVCLGEANVRHHLIQLKNGGINCKKNIVSLCNDCHEEIHPWLKLGVYKPEKLM